MQTLTQQVGYTISGGGNTAYIPDKPGLSKKDVAINLYLTGAYDNGDDEGVYSYIITRRSSSTEDTTITSKEPSGLIYYKFSGNSADKLIWNTFISGYQHEIIAEIPVEVAPYFTSTDQAKLYSGTANPASGMTPSTGIYTNNDTGRVYMYQDWNWEPNVYYWYYVGARDKSGNATNFSGMKAHPWNPYYGNIGYTEIPIPVADNTPPTGMYFYT